MLESLSVITRPISGKIKGTVQKATWCAVYRDDAIDVCMFLSYFLGAEEEICFYLEVLEYFGRSPVVTYDQMEELFKNNPVHMTWDTTYFIY